MKMNFVVKYKAKEWDEIIGNKKVVERIRSNVESNNIQHMIFCGRAGIGKNTTFDVMVDKLGWSSINRFNASDDRGIDFIRGKIKSLSMYGTPDGNPRIILMDEGDGLTKDAQGSLKPMMEDMKRSGKCYIVFLANNPEKFIQPIKSRCDIFNFRPVNPEEIANKLMFIANKEKIDMTSEAINKIADLSGGDVRAAINMLEGLSKLDRKITDKDIESSTVEYSLDNLISSILAKDFYGSSKLVLSLLDYQVNIQQ
jgi:replication factor C small subunit